MAKIQIYFCYFLGLQGVSPGDLSERINLRSKLKCKSFRWYLEKVFPESNLRKEYRMLGEVSLNGMKGNLLKCNKMQSLQVSNDV